MVIKTRKYHHTITSIYTFPDHRRLLTSDIQDDPGYATYYHWSNHHVIKNNIYIRSMNEYRSYYIYII